MPATWAFQAASSQPIHNNAAKQTARLQGIIGLQTSSRRHGQLLQKQHISIWGYSAATRCACALAQSLKQL